MAANAEDDPALLVVGRVLMGKDCQPYLENFDGFEGKESLAFLNKARQFCCPVTWLSSSSLIAS